MSHNSMRFGIFYQQQNQLDFLLSKASEYSNFISKDLEELQSAMADKARQKAEKAEKRKRKSSKGSKSKKQKGNSGEALKSAFEKDAQVRTGSKPIFTQPPNLSKGCVLKDYQLEGVRWLASLYENGVSGILADEMGLGKTIQVIGLVAHLLTQEVTGPFLVVAPLATLPNWVREFEKWLPSKPVARYHGPAPDREAMLKGVLNPKEKRDKKFPVVVTSFETAIRDQKKLSKLGPFAYVIVDEGHRLKNHRCMLIRSLKQLDASNRLLLTGTPIQNTLDELWALLNFVNPQIFDDLSVFQSVRKLQNCVLNTDFERTSLFGFTHTIPPLFYSDYSHCHSVVRFQRHWTEIAQRYKRRRYYARTAQEQNSYQVARNSSSILVASCQN